MNKKVVVLARDRQGYSQKVEVGKATAELGSKKAKDTKWVGTDNPVYISKSELELLLLLDEFVQENKMLNDTIGEYIDKR